jgi:RNA-binding protein 8A
MKSINVLGQGLMNTERYEITLDNDDDVDMGDGEVPAAEPASMLQLKSTAVHRRGRGFTDQSGTLLGGLSSVSAFDQVIEPDDSHVFLPSGGTLAERSVEGWVVFITGVHEEASEEDLKDKLSDYGTVKDLKLALDHRTGYAKGYAIAEFREYREARAAIDALDGRPFMGQPIKIDFAFIRPVVMK